MVRGSDTSYRFPKRDCGGSASSGHSSLFRGMVAPTGRCGPARDQHPAQNRPGKSGAARLRPRTRRPCRGAGRRFFVRARQDCSRSPSADDDRILCGIPPSCPDQGWRDQPSLLGLANRAGTRDASDDLVARRHHAGDPVGWACASCKRPDTRDHSRRDGCQTLVFDIGHARKWRGVDRPQTP